MDQLKHENNHLGNRRSRAVRARPRSSRIPHTVSVSTPTNGNDLAAKIRALQPGPSFRVKDKRERIEAIRTAAAMRMAGVATHIISTRALGDGSFAVFAIARP